MAVESCCLCGALIVGPRGACVTVRLDGVTKDGWFHEPGCVGLFRRRLIDEFPGVPVVEVELEGDSRIAPTGGA